MGRKPRQRLRDRISELPADIVDMILGFLPIEQAARMAWDVWMSATLYVINKVLNQHNGLIRTFFIDFQHLRNTLRSRSFDLDQWLLFVTQKGVEEIDLSLMVEDEYRLPNCIFSCLTLRRLYLNGVSVESINAHCTLPNVTLLCFRNIDFDGVDLPVQVDFPMLKYLSFMGCNNLSNLNISAQKLYSLTINNCLFCQLPFNLDLRSVCTLDLDSYAVKDFVKGCTRRGLQPQPLVLNVECLILSESEIYTDDISSEFIHLLRICPKLWELDLSLSLARAETTKQAWDILEVSHKGVVRAQKSKLQSLRRLYDRCEMTSTETVDMYFSRLIDLVNKMRLYGDTVADSAVVEKILQTMPMKYDHVVASITESHDTEDLTIAELKGMIESHVERIESKSEPLAEEALKSQVTLDMTGSNQRSGEFDCWYKEDDHEQANVAEKCGESSTEPEILFLASNSLSADENICCLIGKKHREPFPVGKSKRATKQLEIVHSDLCSVEVPSNGGSRYTPQQNGVAERKNRSIMDMVSN
ncbi:F-box/LRR-repeat protein At3g03360-like [Ipomoea triloba]|uniref:F-box/LRR-repeat protein At3g03360-like n=1 Tax=Ipomoea triloba TaxID=35885 RepID=UPI00125D1278|nr:F-box/LRR-repeat protein At3g03360-like [Ipomoea triloba]